MSFSYRRNRFLSGSPFFCLECGRQLQVGEKVFVVEEAWQRVADLNGKFVLVQCLSCEVFQGLLCKVCELKVKGKKV